MKSDLVFKDVIDHGEKLIKKNVFRFFNKGTRRAFHLTVTVRILKKDSCCVGRVVEMLLGPIFQAYRRDFLRNRVSERGFVQESKPEETAHL